ncbi:MAG: hypothetical protein ACTSW1_13440, partial [Candidatus Hodarchaeales archaeon]
MKITLLLFLGFLVVPTFLGPINLNYSSPQGCHKPYVSWLYPQDNFNMSGLVTVYWYESEADYYEIITYSLFYSINGSNSTIIIAGLGSSSYDLDTTLLPQNQTITHIVESFDSYVIERDTVDVYIDQSTPVTPLDPSILENPDECQLDNVISTLTNGSLSRPLNYDWTMIFLGLVILLIPIKLKLLTNN